MQLWIVSHEVKVSMTSILWPNDNALYLEDYEHYPMFDLNINVGHCDLYFMV